MANPDHLYILQKGVEEWNRWREEENIDLPNFRGADLGGEDLSGADFSAADFDGANLSRTNLRWGVFKGANLSEVNLNEADLTDACFSGTFLGNIDLSTVIGLTEVEHWGPSTIGIDTIYRSGGKIPEIFLRGCGVADTFIAFMDSLVGRPIEFYSCFISYSSHDQDFATRLHNDLQSNGVRCWYASKHVQGGKRLHEQIDQAIRVHDKLLLILSPASMESSWVKTEINKARKREKKENRRVLFPVRLVEYDMLRDWECFDADMGTDSAAEVREYFIPDFSNWKNHDNYKNAFDRDLKIETVK